uniref:Uncharacterized protein n=1 Tax=Lates calcarifer TaxID=8187 RepID=A0A4W6DZZ5_LATCA
IGYRVDFCEPDTSWKLDPYELEKRNKHGVPQEKITQMLDRFSSPVSIDIVMSSQEPPHAPAANYWGKTMYRYHSNSSDNQQSNSECGDVRV